MGSIPGSGRSPGGGHGSSRQYSCLGNRMDRGAWQAAVLGSQRVGCDLAKCLSIHTDTHRGEWIAPADTAFPKCFECQDTCVVVGGQQEEKAETSF